MDTVKELAGPIITLIGTGAGVAKGFLDKPKMPKLDIPEPKETPTMPAPDDKAARAAGLKAIAQRASQKGRQSTNLYEKDTLG